MKKLSRIISAVLTAAMLSSVALCAPFTVSAAETDGNSTSVLNNVEVDSKTQEATEQSSAESTEAVESEKEETVYRGLISDHSKLKQSAEVDGDATESGEYVTRVQWLSDLTETFNMTVEEENYPDNYFSDISSSDSCYHAVMLATEFGVINVEAGGEVRPNDYATRDFCASTLNYCLGFKLDEGTTYTYDDYSVTTHPEDAQIAINRGWFNPSDNKFEQDSYVTPEESKAMLDDAAGVLDKTKVDSNYNNKFEFNENVIVIPKGTVASKSDDTVTIYNSTVTIKNGDTFAVYFGEVPDIFIASKVEKSGTKTVISVTEADFDESVKTADAEGTEECSVSDIEPAEGVELSFEEEEDTPAVVSGSPLLKSSGSKNLKSVNAKKTLKLGDVSLTIKCKLYNLSADYIVKSGANRHYMVRINGEAEVTTTASVKDIISALGGESSIDIMSYSVPGIGKVGISLYVSISGEITLAYDTYFSVGAEYTSGSGFRTINNFYKKSFSVTADINADIGVKASAEVNIMNVISGGIWARMGLKANLNIKSYSDGKSPKTCTTFKAWLYADMGCYIGISAFGFSKSYSNTITFFDQSNSPVRLYFHNEDGKQVSHCSRGDCSYITSGYSRYGYSGYGSGRGYNAAGEPITIFKYSLDSDNNATITGYYGNVSALAIPKTIDGYTVVGIGSKAFEGNTLLKVVTIPDSVTSIGNYAFRNCKNLNEAVLSKSLTSLGREAFAYTAINEIEIPKSLNVCYGEYDNLDYTGFRGPFSQCSNLKTVTFEKGTTLVAKYLFSGCTGLENITIPNTVTEIGLKAFGGCTNLKSIELSDSLTKINFAAFAHCDAITNIVLTNSITDIGNSAFRNCSNLISVAIPNSVTAISNYAFENCIKISNISIPDSVTSINSYAFSKCTSLESVKLSKCLTYLGEDAFGNCTALTEIEIPKSLERCSTSWTDKDGPFYNCSKLKKITFETGVTHIAGRLFTGCTGIENINIPDTVTSINSYAFSNCTSLESVKLSKCLTYLGEEAFGNCTALTEIEIPKSLEMCSTSWTDKDGPFYNCSKLKKITFETGVTRIVGRLFAGCTGIENINIPDTVTSIDGYAFRNCSNLISVAIPNSVTAISTYAFENCIKISNISIPDSVTSINSYAFSKCTSLESVKLSKCLTYLGVEAFGNCTALTEIEIPKSLERCSASWTDKDGPFYNCSKLKKITFETGVTHIAGSLFTGCTGIENINIPNTVTIIDGYAFSNCSNLISVDIPNSVTAISDNAFENCIKISSISIPDSVTSMGKSIFANCSSLETVTLPSKIQNIMESTFQNCSSLKTVNFTNSVTNIREYAFSGCTALESIKLSGNLTDIAQYAFYGCTSLKEISIPDKVKNIGYSAFQNCSSLVTVNIPSRVKSIGSYAFQNCELLENVNIADYSIKTINEATFKDCPALKKITLPKGLTTISKLAFANDTALAEVTIPESVTSITTDAFSYPAKMTAYGYEKSYAKSYCDEKGIKFVDNHILSQGICIDPSVCDSEDYIIMEVGETKEMKFEVYPLDSNDVITLTSNNTRVSIDGMHITSKSAGDSVITATATSGVTYSFTIHTRSVKNVTLNSLPVKTKYNQGENFDSKGMELQVNYGDKSTKIAEDYTISGYDPDTIGIQTITVSYVGLNGSTYKTTFEIEVVDPRGKLTGISIAKLPDKLNYKKYESLDTTGLVVVENYDSGVSVEISDYSVSGYNALKLGKQTITVTKGEFSTAFEVTVSDKSSAVIGDVNGDGSVTVLDATMLQKYLAGLASFSDEQLAVADTNGDGKITVLDATAIQKYLAGLVTSLG